jgi:hypothetical protein
MRNNTLARDDLAMLVTLLTALSKYLNDFADITEIRRLKSFPETRVDALQLGDGVSLGLRLDCNAYAAGGNPQTP